MTAASRAWAALWSSTRLSTWAPRRRTHLLCAACAGALTMLAESESPVWPEFEAAGGLAIALVSVRPAVGGALSFLVAYVFLVVARGSAAAVLPVIGPWLCASVLLTRSYSRAAAYSLVVASTTGRIVSLLLFPSDYYSSDFDIILIITGCGCLVVAGLMRRPREAADAAVERYQEDLERQRLLVVFELHDTVVRDLTRAVMLADRARLAQPPDAPLGPELAAMAGSVRTVVEQLRANLRAISGAAGVIAGAAGRDSAAGDVAGTAGKDSTAGDGDGAADRSGVAGDVAGLDVLALSAPRPIAEVVAEARAVLAGRGIALEIEGLELLEADAVPPGVHRQLVRVLGELVSNMAKYAAPGSARIIVDSDGRSLEAMAANAAPPQNGADAAASSMPAVSSGLGLAGARRRVESLGGVFDATRTAERFTVILSVPLSR
ncbi:ATP-binding protein [Actinomyces israelii]|uniref:ATP-binding protein n=1 Tax=Actinomyces israelii TaxID=1659 RepID=UPI0023534CFB|nr:ATP-binding protein [Actinomyces israelii]